MGGLGQGLGGCGGVMSVCVVSLDYMCRWHVQVSVYCTRRITAHLMCTQCSIMLHLVDICFLTCICLWQISQIQTWLRVVDGPGLFSTLPAFMRSIASHRAGSHGRLAQKTASGPLVTQPSTSANLSNGDQPASPTTSSDKSPPESPQSSTSSILSGSGRPSNHELGYSLLPRRAYDTAKFGITVLITQYY